MDLCLTFPSQHQYISDLLISARLSTYTNPLPFLHLTCLYTNCYELLVSIINTFRLLMHFRGKSFVYYLFVAKENIFLLFDSKVSQRFLEFLLIFSVSDI